MFSTPETKPFYLTSEFWLLVIAGVNSVVIGNPTDTRTLVMDALAAIYSIARGIAKSGTPYEPELAETAPTSLPTQEGDIGLQFPHELGGGTKGAQPGEPPAAAVGLGQAKLDRARELLSENPELVQQLRSEGVIV